KHVLGFRQFLLRGFDSVQSEWSLVCLGWNLKRIHALKVA
ncbi:MAG: transposase, partial [Pseudomonadales bacterium]|nr:transposase [Pseudomonadales bacterium]